MKILILTLEYPPTIGGIASYVTNVAEHMPAANIVVYAPKNKASKILDALHPWKVYRQNPYWFMWPHWLRAVFQVWKICRKEKISRIHVHQALPMGYAAWAMSKIKKIPYTVFLHGTDVEMVHKSLSKRRRLQQVLRGADQIIVNSQFLQNKVQRLFEKLKTIIIYPSPSDIFFDTVSEDKIHALKTRLALSGKKVIITVARLAEGKGFPHVIRVLPEILKHVPNAVWLIIGDGPKKQEIMASIQQKYLQNVVRFLGSIPHEELPLYLQSADLFLLMTHPDEAHEEGWGTAFLEAAASGLPIVAGRAGGVEEAVEHLVNGIVVDVHQDKAVVGAVVELLKNTTYARQMGEAGKHRIHELGFTWTEQLKKIIPEASK